ncbi:hypothetical protein ACTFIV_001274 [Dictyostelium citrinum]
MKFQHTLITLLSLLTFVNGYDYFTTTLANQNPVCAAVDVPLDRCTNVCGRFVKYTTDTSATNQFNFTEYTTIDCNIQVTPAVTNTFVCADQVASHQLNTDWSGICRITNSATTPPPVTNTPNPTPSQSTPTTGSAPIVVSSFSLILFSMILALC